MFMTISMLQQFKSLIRILYILILMFDVIVVANNVYLNLNVESESDEFLEQNDSTRGGSGGGGCMGGRLSEPVDYIYIYIL